MLLVTSPSVVSSRAAINAIALKAHRRDSAHTLVEDITTKLPREIPVTEKSMEAIILKSKGPYSKEDVNKLMTLLDDTLNHPIKPDTQGKDNAQLLGLIAIDLAKYHPFEPGLKEGIIQRIKEMEKYPLFKKEHYYLNNFVAALYLIDQSTAQQYIDKYGLNMKSIEADIELEISNN